TGIVDRQELPTNVYRLDKTGRATVVVDDIKGPDGLAFSPDEKKLYIIEDGASPQVFRVYDVVDDGTRLANGRTFITVERGRGIAKARSRSRTLLSCWCRAGGTCQQNATRLRAAPAQYAIGWTCASSAPARPSCALPTDRSRSPACGSSRFVRCARS